MRRAFLGFNLCVYYILEEYFLKKSKKFQKTIYKMQKS